MLISGSCLPKPGECPGTIHMALAGWPYGPIYRRLEIIFRPRRNPTSLNEGTAVVIIGGMIFAILSVVLLILPEIRYGG